MVAITMLTGIMLILIGIWFILSGAAMLMAAEIIILGAGRLSTFLLGLVPYSIMDIVSATNLTNAPSSMITDTIDDTAGLFLSTIRWFGVFRIVDGAILLIVSLIGMLSKNKILAVIFIMIGVALSFAPLHVGVSVFRLIVLGIFAVGILLKKAKPNSVKDEKIILG